jgi:hypothetical protein
MQSAMPRSAQAYGETDSRKAPIYRGLLGEHGAYKGLGRWPAYIESLAAAGEEHICTTECCQCPRISQLSGVFVFSGNKSTQLTSSHHGQG